MAYWNDLDELTSDYMDYLGWGMKPQQVALGVQAGPPGQSSQFTSPGVTRQAAAWQPTGATRLGMMLYSFSQDIEAFTTLPQHSKPYPSPGDHQWQTTIIDTMYNLSSATPAAQVAAATGAEPELVS